MPATDEPRAALLQAIERIEVALISVDDASYPTSAFRASGNPGKDGVPAFAGTSGRKFAIRLERSVL